jgi:indole-3-glycerol phosphate synthase
MACLSDAQAQELFAASAQMGMDALIEVHDERELERALTHLGARMIGINNRSLRTFETSLETSIRLAKMLPRAMLAVSESGIFTHDDVKRLQAESVQCFLVGESLMRETDITAATRALLGTA